MNCDYCFRHFVGSLFSFQHFQAKVNGNILCSSSGFRDKTLYIKGWKMSQSVSTLILFVILKTLVFFVASYAIISNLFTSTTVFLLNYSSGIIKTNSIQLVWHFLKRFGIFVQVVWHFLFTWTWQPWLCYPLLCCLDCKLCSCVDW